MAGGLPLPWVSEAVQGLLGLIPVVVGLPRVLVSQTAQKAAGKYWLCAGLDKGSLSQVRGLWFLLPQQ